MATSSLDRRIPKVAAVLSAVVPGLGLVYAGRPRAAAILLCVEVAAFLLGWNLLLLMLHPWQVLMAAGEASVAGVRNENIVEVTRARAATLAALAVDQPACEQLGPESLA